MERVQLPQGFTATVTLSSPEIPWYSFDLTRNNEKLSQSSQTQQNFICWWW